MEFKSMAAAAAIAMTCIVPAAHASYIYTSQGVDFTISLVDDDTFTLRIQNVLDATANWADATQYNALAFKNIGNVTAATITPNGLAGVLHAELAAQGCQDPNGKNPSICFSYSPLLAMTNDDLFTIDVTGGSLSIDNAEGPHLKVAFANAQGTVIGDLLSMDLNFVAAPPPGTPDQLCTDPNGCSNVPEPNSGGLALLGLGLLGGALLHRRKNARLS